MNKIKKNILIFITVILALISITTGSIFLHQVIDEKKSEDVFKYLDELVIKYNGEDISNKTEQELAYEKYVELQKKNDDFIGWIYIEATNVNYPVMQTIDSPNYYLKRNFEKEYSNYGVPYLDEKCAIDLTNNLIIYGHNMKNGTMFTDILKYSDENFYKSHQIISFDTMAEFIKYQVMYAFMFDTDNEDFFYHDFEDMNEERFNEFISECEERKIYDTGITAEYGDQLITLSTCEYSHENGRFVVVGKKISEEEHTHNNLIINFNKSSSK